MDVVESERGSGVQRPPTENALAASHRRHAQHHHQHQHQGPRPSGAGVGKRSLRAEKTSLDKSASPSSSSSSGPQVYNARSSLPTSTPSIFATDPFARDTRGQGQADSIYARITWGSRLGEETSSSGAPRPPSPGAQHSGLDDVTTVVINADEDSQGEGIASQLRTGPQRPYSRHSRLVSSSTFATGYLTSPSSSYLELDHTEHLDEHLDELPPTFQSSPERSLVDLPFTSPRPPRRSLMRPSPLGKWPAASGKVPQVPEDGYETSSTIGPGSRRRSAAQSARQQPHAKDILQEMPEMAAAHDAHEALEARDKVSHMKTEQTLGVIAMGLGYTNAKNQSSVSVASRHKADKVLGLDPNAKLASFYLVSGLPRGYGDWTVADLEATRGLNPMQDSLGMFWRPDVLGNCFSGQKTEDYLQQISRQRKESSASHHSSISPMSLHTRGVHVPDAGQDGPMKILQKTLKFAHPRDVEVINSTLCPPSHCHSFTFSIPKHDTLAAVARTRLQSSLSGGNKNGNYQDLLEPETDAAQASTYVDTAVDSKRNMSTSAELVFYGVTLTIYTPAEKDRSYYLKKLKERRERAQNGQVGDSLRSRPRTPVPPGREGEQGRAQTDKPAQKGKSRASMPWGLARKASVGEYSASETEGAMSDSDFEGGVGARASAVGSVGDEPLVDDGGDVFWLPYAVTIVSRHPIYDFLQDYLRLTWARYSKNAKQHMVHIARILNLDTPRPGSTYRIDVTNGFDDKITVEATFPGGFNLGQGAVIPGVDFQIWPMFQALDLDVILTCIEVAMSNSGRVILYSKHSMMLGICVQSLYHILEMRNWKGLHMPILHARDVSLVVEDPGPYILGVPLECRYMVTIPSEVAIVDIDTNTLTCANPPISFLNSRARREKARQRLAAAFGPGLPLDRSVPTEFKICFPNGAFANLNKMHVNGVRPAFLRAERVRAPAWWQHAEVMAAFDKVMLGKDKKPSLLERLTKSSAGRYEGHLTPGEMTAKTQMRRRALHYVETRDQLEVKIAHINKKLAKLIQEGEHWKKQFEKFEAFADKLNTEANDLRSKIDREKREARRLSALATEKSEENTALQEQLKRVLNVHQETMIKLSDAGSALSEVRQQTQDMHDQFDYFDAQLDHALMAYGIGRYSRPPTPSEANADSPQSRTTALKHTRPGTRDSQRSLLSRHTVESSLSVLGAAHKVKARSKGVANGGANGQTRADGIKEDEGEGEGEGEAGDAGSKVVPSAYKRLSKSRPGTASTVGRGDGGVGLGHDKADAIAMRIASITAKLDLALSAVHAGSAASIAGDTSDSADDSSVPGLGLQGLRSSESQRNGASDNASDTETGAETESDEKDGKSQASATPVASRRQSTASFSDAPPMPERLVGGSSNMDAIKEFAVSGGAAAAHLDVDVDAELPVTPLSPEYHSADEPTSSTDDEHTRPSANTARTHERKVSAASSLGVVRPGVSLRIKRRDGSGGNGDASDAESIESQTKVTATKGNKDHRPTDGGHAKMSTEGSGLSELLISPSASDVSVASVQSGGSVTSRASAGAIKIRPKRRGEVPGTGDAGERGEKAGGKQAGKAEEDVKVKEAGAAQVRAKRWSGASAFGQV